MSQEDLRLLFRHFGEDLDALERHASGVDVRASDLRQVVAPILRRWFDDSLIYRVQREIGQLLISVDDLRALTRACERGHVRFFAGIKANVLGTPISNFVLGTNAVEEDLPATAIEVVHLPLQDFARQRVLFGSQVFATRIDVIKFVANKWGGVHLDARLTDRAHAMIDETRFYYGFKVEDGRLQMVVNFDGSFKIQQRSFPNDFLDVALLALLNTAQALCFSLRPYRQGIAEFAG